MTGTRVKVTVEWLGRTLDGNPPGVLTLILAALITGALAADRFFGGGWGFLIVSVVLWAAASVIVLRRWLAVPELDDVEELP